MSARRSDPRPAAGSTLPGTVAACLAAHAMLQGITGILIAVSGGVDSLTLLVALAELSADGALPGVGLRVATLDHGLRGDAGAADARFVVAEAARLGLPWFAEALAPGAIAADAAQRGVGIEDAARLARYAFLERAAAAWSDEHGAAIAIATGHHRDDQAETVLLHLLRGAGLAGLRGMLPVGELGGQRRFRLIRPLLDIPKADLHAFLAARGLSAREDATNADVRYTRNRIRHELLPLLRTFNPAIEEALARTAAMAQADYAALAALIPPYPYRLEAFRAVPRAVQRMALLARPEWRQDVTFADIEQAIDRVVHGGPGFVPCGPLTLCVGFDRFTVSASGEADLLPIEAPALPRGFQLDLTAPLQVAEPGVPVTIQAGDGWHILVTLHAADESAQHGAAPNPDQGAEGPGQYRAALLIPADARIEVRTWRTGERFRPAGMGGHRQLLSDMWTNARVPAAWRPHIPLITVDGEAACFAAPTPSGLRVRVWQSVQNPTIITDSTSRPARKLCIIVFQHLPH